MPAPHRCHVPCCPERVPRRLLMCARHWKMVPAALQRDVWATYRPGQEQGRARVSTDYLAAAKRAIAYVAARGPGEERR